MNNNQWIDVKLTDALVLPVMAKYNIDREEAEKRLQLLYKSSILPNTSPDNLDDQEMIDNFLAQDSETLAQTVLFETCFTSCLENREFVKNYDRLSGRNLSKVLRLLHEGQVPSNAKKEYRKFELFVRDTVFAAWINSLPEPPKPQQ